MGATGIVILLACAVYALFEALCLASLVAIHRKTGVYYLPRGKPRLSASCIGFIGRFVAEKGRGVLMEHDANLGWALRPNVRSEDGLYATNARGARTAREYPRVPGPGTVRVTTFGDCLTFGEDLPEESTWQRAMERLSPGFEVINFGVDGYDPGQMLMRFRESLGFYAGQRAAVLAFVTSNIYKPLNVFRPFYAYDHGIKLAKPAFTIADGVLRRIPNPMESLSRYERLIENPREELARLGSLDRYYLTSYSSGPFDFLPSVRLAKIVSNEYRRRSEVFDRYGRYRNGSDALRTAVSVVDEFCALARREGALPVIAFFPLKKDIGNFLRRGLRPYSPLIEHCERMAHPFVDMLDVFKECGGDGDAGEIFIGRHYSARANEVIARRLVDCIRRNLR